MIDDGRTGTSDETRPEYQRLLQDIRAGKVNCMICKNLSRAFRNYADQGKFLEEFLPTYKARFVAISNPFVDTFTDPDCTQNMEIPINGLMNDRYAAKTSADVRRTFDTKRRNGEFIGAFAPYGYDKDPKDKNVLIVDEAVAGVVRDIFRWFVDGMSKGGIAKLLNEKGIPNPTAYKRSRGFKYQNPHAAENDGLWNPTCVSRLLQNPMYTGIMVQGKQKVISYKVHGRMATDESDWFVVPNTHPAIVDRETFDKAQSLHKRDTRTAPGKRDLYLFSGFVRCADCQKAMSRKSSKGFTYYVCRTNRDKSAQACTKHTIREDVLETVVLTVLQKQIELVGELVNVIDEINAAPTVRNESTRLTAMLKQRTKELEKVSALLDGLYVDWKSGEITREQYSRMKVKFEDQAEQLRASIEKITEECEVMAAGVRSDDPYLTTFLKYRNIKSLNRGILIELVKTIYVHEGGEIEIEFTFTDQHRRIMDFIENNRRELTVIHNVAV